MTLEQFQRTQDIPEYQRELYYGVRLICKLRK